MTDDCHNIVDQRFLCSLETLIDLFRGSKLAKCFSQIVEVVAKKGFLGSDLIPSRISFIAKIQPATWREPNFYHICRYVDVFFLCFSYFYFYFYRKRHLSTKYSILGLALTEIYRNIC